MWTCRDRERRNARMCDLPVELWERPKAARRRTRPVTRKRPLQRELCGHTNLRRIVLGVWQCVDCLLAVSVAPSGAHQRRLRVPSGQLPIPEVVESVRQAQRVELAEVGSKLMDERGKVQA